MRGPVFVGRVAAVAAAVALTGAAAAAQVVNPSDLRREAEALLGGALEMVSGRASAADTAWIPPPVDGALSRAVFSVPVGGGAVSRPVYAEVRNDLVVVLAPQWRIVQALVGDPSRWQVTNNEYVLVVKPLERGAQTNLSLVLASGEVVQLDVMEVTPYDALERVGRVYLGPEPWLLDRVFALLPPGLGSAILAAGVSVPDLLADPARVVYSFLYGRPGGLSGAVRAAPVRRAPPPAAPPVAAPAREPEPVRVVPEVSEALDAGPPLPPGFASGPAADRPSGGAVLPLVPGPPVLPLPSPSGASEPVAPVAEAGSGPPDQGSVDDSFVPGGAGFGPRLCARRVLRLSIRRRGCFRHHRCPVLWTGLPCQAMMRSCGWEGRPRVSMRRCPRR